MEEAVPEAETLGPRVLSPRRTLALAGSGEALLDATRGRGVA